MLHTTRSFGRYTPSRMDLVMVINSCWRNELASDEASGGGGGWLLHTTRSFGRYAPSRMDLVMVINPCWRNELASDEASGGVVDGCTPPPPDPSVASLPPGWT